jgi:AcrR family transcriptional regulator
MTTGRQAPSTRGPYSKSARRRQEILEKAIEIFVRDGVDAGSFRSVATALGVSHTALRYYFPTREALLIAVYEAHEIREQEDEWLGDGNNPLPALRESAARNRAVPGLVQLYASLTADAVQAGMPASTEFVRHRFEVLRSQMVPRIERAQAAGTLPTGVNAKDLSSLVVAASDGLQIQWLLDPDSVNVERVLELLERLLGAAADGRAGHAHAP